MENFATYRLTQTGPETQAILDQVNENTTDIAQLRALYEALTQSDPVIIQPSDPWPVANPEENVIYRVIDRVNTPPESYSDYMWNGTAMVLMATYNNAIDSTPTAGSNNPVASGGVLNYVSTNGSAYDISAAHSGTAYEDLAAALGTDGANVPSAVRKGGMSIKFVQTSDNKYVRYNYLLSSTTNADIANVNNWQGVDEEVVAGSKNVVMSGGVAKGMQGELSKFGRLSLSDGIYTENYILFNDEDVEYPYDVIIEGSLTRESNAGAIGFFDSSDTRLAWYGFAPADTVTHKTFTYKIPSGFFYAKVIWGSVKIDSLSVRGADYKGLSLADDWICVSGCNISFLNNTLTIGTGTLYFTKNEKIVSKVMSEAATFTFENTGRLVFDIVSKTISLNYDTDNVKDTEIVLAAYNASGYNAGFVGGLLFDYYLNNKITEVDNLDIVSRASVTFPDSNTVKIGAGYIYVRKGDKLLMSLNHSSEETFDVSGIKYLVMNISNGTIEVSSDVSARQWVLLWHDGVMGFIGGLLYKYYTIHRINEVSDDVNKVLDEDNLEVVSRAPITFTGSTSITIGSGAIYIRKGDRLLKNINHSTAETFALSGSVYVVFNQSNNTISTSATVQEGQWVLLWRDGTMGIIGGLLYKYYQKQEYITEYKTLRLDNLDLCSRAPITFTSDDSLTIGTGDMYIRRGNAVLFVKTYATSQTFTFEGGSLCLVVNKSNGAISIVNSNDVTEDHWILLWKDNNAHIVGGLLYKYYMEYKNGKAISSALLEYSPAKSDVITIQHGATTDYPENTLTLFKTAAQRGILYWETDVRPCLDGYVLCHDNDIYKYAVTANGDTIPEGTVLISQSTVAQLQQYKFGVLSNHQSEGLVPGFENDTIPTLQQFLTLARAAGAVPVLEIKFSPTQSQINDIVDIVKANCMLDKTYFACYSSWENVFNYGRQAGIKKFIIVYNNGECSTAAVDAVYNVVRQYINELEIIFDPTITNLNATPTAADYAIGKGFSGISGWTVWSGMETSAILSAFENKCNYFFSNKRLVDKIIYEQYVLQ